MQTKTKKILILGASGFIGYTLYRELCNYFDTYGTYCSNKAFSENKKFFWYDVQEEAILKIVRRVKPDVVISALRGDFDAQIRTHEDLVEYVKRSNCSFYFISSANVFDAYSKYPSYEMDKTLSKSIYGKLKIRIENMLLRLPPKKMGILRVPMVFGNTSPRIKELKLLLHHKEPIEVFPNLIINVTHDDRLAQQVHYLVNREKKGIFHLGSTDLVHHEEFIHEVIKRLGTFDPIYKKVYTTNEDRYLAVLPKSNRLPKNLEVGLQQIIDHHLTVD